MLGVDERGDAPLFLRVGDGMEGERRLAARFGAVHLDDAAARVATDAEGDVEPDAARGDDRHVGRKRLAFAQTHDRPLAVLLLDARDGEVDGLCAVLVLHGGSLLRAHYTVFAFR